MAGIRRATVLSTVTESFLNGCRKQAHQAYSSLYKLSNRYQLRLAQLYLLLSWFIHFHCVEFILATCTHTCLLERDTWRLKFLTNGNTLSNSIQYICLKKNLTCLKLIIVHSHPYPENYLDGWSWFYIANDFRFSPSIFFYVFYF